MASKDNGIELHALPAIPGQIPSALAQASAPSIGDGDSANAPLNRPDTERQRVNESVLAPVDRGLGAWSFLSSAFIVQALVWGFPNAYGVFLLKYLEDPAYANQKHASLLLPLVGPMASGVQYSAAAITFSLASRYPRYRRRGIWLGTLISFVSLFAASYTKDVRSLVILQGALYGLGGALLNAAAVYYMSEWFVERHGLANGVIGAGSSVGGLLLPLILPSIIDKYGTAKTVRYYAIINVSILMLAVPFLRSRLPESRVAHAAHPRGSTSGRSIFLKDRNFWVINIANTIQSLAYFVPLLWLPTYASSIQLSSRGVSLSLAMLNASGLIGRLGLGALSDVMDAWFLACATLCLSAFSVFVLWGVLSYTLAGLLSFAIIYGCLAGGWTSLWSRFIRPIAKDDPSLTTSMYGSMMLFRGIGNILSTPISAALLSGVDPNKPELSTIGSGMTLGGAFKGQYEKVIVYAGTCFAAAALVVVVGWIMNGRSARRGSALRAQHD